MHVQWAIPCRYVEIAAGGGGATIIGAGADVGVAAKLPAVIQRMFAVRYVGTIDEMDGTTAHPITCKLFDPQNEQIGEQSAALRADAVQIIPDFLVELIVPSAIVFDVKEYGTYSVQFGIDASDPVKVPIHFVHQLPPELGGPR